MRAVLDTNVLISALLWRGAAYECLVAAEAGWYELVLADPILDELRETLIRKFENTPNDADERVASLRRRAVSVTLTGRGGWVRADPADDKFVEAAMLSRADLIVSGDHHLLELGTIVGIPLLSPSQFL